MSADGNIVHFYHTYRAKICVYLPWFLDVLEDAQICSAFQGHSDYFENFLFYTKGFFKFAAFCSYSVGEVDW